MKVVVGLIGLVSLFTIALGNGELSILHSPNGINFKGNEPVKTSELPKIISTALGHTTQTDDTWDGLTILNPFNYPQTAAVIVIEGLASLRLADLKFPLQVNTPLQQVKEDFSFMLGQIVYDENDVSTGTNQEDLVLKKLDAQNTAVAEFVKDIQVLRDLKQRVLSKIQLGNIWIQLSGLDKIVREYGQDSEEVLEAVTLLKSALDQVETNMEKTYRDRFLLVAVSDDRHHPRTKRAAKDVTNGTSSTPNDKPNFSKQYRDDYAAIFNIILWMSVFLIAALISTAVFICTLDPGRDSIIYRMTTQRIKKDN